MLLAIRYYGSCSLQQVTTLLKDLFDPTKQYHLHLLWVVPIARSLELCANCKMLRHLSECFQHQNRRRQGQIIATVDGNTRAGEQFMERCISRDLALPAGGRCVSGSRTERITLICVCR